MKRLAVFTAVAAATVVATMIAAGGALAAVQHGITLTKGCVSPVKIGDPYSCSYSIRNFTDEAHDTLTVDSLVDTVHAAGGDTSSGNIFGTLQLEFVQGAAVTPPSCTGGTGLGTVGSPYTGATSCTLPFGSRINIGATSHYTVQAADFGLTNHQLKDDAALGWHDLCNDPAGTQNDNCNPEPPATNASSLAVVQQLGSATDTVIHKFPHQVVTAVAAGTAVHDFVTVTGQPGKPLPTGNIFLQWFTNGACTLPATNTSGTIPLDGNGQAEGTAFLRLPATPGQYAFRAHYLGDALYAASDGPCEPLAVVDANISITPNGTNPVGTTHTFTAHVNVNNGSGFANAPAATPISFTIDGGGPGSFTTPNPCATVAATGSCTITLTSATAGTTVVSAHVTASVGGVTLTRHTNGSGANSGPATKLWADDTVRTDVHDASHGVITSVLSATVVHDKAFVTRTAVTPAGVPDPTGNVVFHRFTSFDCTGSPIDETVALAGGTAESSTFNAQTSMSYRADYLGDANYPARPGACEPLEIESLACPAGSFNYSFNQNGDLVIVYDQFPAPNDNSYGINAVGWGNHGHSFKDLHNSDHAGFKLVNQSGSTKLAFNIDYITTKSGTASGYASLGPFGGDGGVLTGSLTPADLTWDTSFARDLNNLGYFAGGVQNPATINTTNGTNLLVNSPPTLSSTSYVLKTPNPWTGTMTYAENGRTVTGWDFHNTYFVTIKAAKLASLGFNAATWKVLPGLDQLHNSPAKACPA